MKKGQIHIGTSGWSYKHWKNTFYPEGTKDQLFFYASHFQSVEINNSFYHLPSPDTFHNWRKNTPSKFIFSVKASRYITHMKKLKEGEETFKAFLKNASELKEKLGPILFQLPPNWKLNTERLKNFLNVLPSKYQYAFEFRNSTWYDENIYSMLKDHNCAFCIYELNHHISPIIQTTDFVYIRLHGPGEKYAGSYSNVELKKWAKRCQQWTESGTDVFIYFDNDQLAYAPKNAETLLKMIPP